MLIKSAQNVSDTLSTLPILCVPDTPNSLLCIVFLSYIKIRNRLKEKNGRNKTKQKNVFLSSILSNTEHARKFIGTKQPHHCLGKSMVNSRRNDCYSEIWKLTVTYLPYLGPRSVTHISLAINVLIPSPWVRLSIPISKSTAFLRVEMTKKVLKKFGRIEALREIKNKTKVTKGCCPWCYGRDETTQQSLWHIWCRVLLTQFNYRLFIYKQLNRLILYTRPTSY